MLLQLVSFLAGLLGPNVVYNGGGGGRQQTEMGCSCWLGQLLENSLKDIVAKMKGPRVVKDTQY